MSVQLALLKSNEEVIADIKEFRDSDDNLVQYLFKDPHTVQIKTPELLTEDATPKYHVVFRKWMSLSKDTDFFVNKDWIVCITDPLDSILDSYTRRENGRGYESDGRDDATIRLDAGESGTGSTDSTSSSLNEQVTFSE